MKLRSTRFLRANQTMCPSRRTTPTHEKRARLQAHHQPGGASPCVLGFYQRADRFPSSRHLCIERAKRDRLSLSQPDVTGVRASKPAAGSDFSCRPCRPCRAGTKGNELVRLPGQSIDELRGSLPIETQPGERTSNLDDEESLGRLPCRYCSGVEEYARPQQHAWAPMVAVQQWRRSHPERVASSQDGLVRELRPGISKRRGALSKSDPSKTLRLPCSSSDGASSFDAPQPQPVRWPQRVCHVAELARAGHGAPQHRPALKDAPWHEPARLSSSGPS
jgi:hypothetical protein